MGEDESRAEDSQNREQDKDSVLHSRLFRTGKG